jgi:hypothetical protein
MDLSDFGLVPHKAKSLSVGDRYGRLVVKAIGKPPGTYQYKAVCLCDCGKYVAPTVDSMRRGKSISCGCAQRDAVTKHGRSQHPLYQTLRNMKNRCYNPKDKRYPEYGGRGITVCDQWHDLEGFIADMGSSHFVGATIERENVNGNYEPSNCAWVTAKAQASNKRSNIMLSHNGKTQCLQHWADEVGITYGTLWERIKVQKWSAERALTTAPLSADERCELARAQCAENRARR